MPLSKTRHHLAVIIILILSNLCQANAHGSADNITEGKIAHYTLDEARGTTVLDSSGNNRTGTLSGFDTSTDWVNGRHAYALNFDGTDAYINVSSAGFRIQTWTISAWIFRHASGIQAIFDAGRGGQGYYLALNADDTLRSAEYSGSWTNCDTTETVPANIWTHSAATRVNGGNIVVYINGLAKKSCASSGTTTFTPYPESIGARKTAASYGHFFDGLIDNVLIYNRALTANEILQIYRGGVIRDATLRNVKLNDLN